MAVDLYGLLLLLIALKQWRGRPAEGEDAALPKWMQAIDTFRPTKAAGLAVLLSGVNPKNLLLAVGAAAAIAQTGASSGDQAIALAVFVLIGTLGPGLRSRSTSGWASARSACSTGSRGGWAPTTQDHGRPLPHHRRKARGRRDQRSLRFWWQRRRA